MRLGGKGGSQQINCRSHTQQKPLFSRVDSPEPQPGREPSPGPTGNGRPGRAGAAPRGQWAEAGTVLGSPLTQKDSALP